MSSIELFRGSGRSSDLLTCLACIAAGTGYLALLLVAEQQWHVVALILGGALALIVAVWVGATRAFEYAYPRFERLINAALLASVLALIVIFRADTFALLLLSTVLVYGLASIGLNLQFGYIGVLNFAPAAFFGIGAYTAALLSRSGAYDGLLILVSGGIAAVTIGCVLLLPMLRTRGHYAAVVTIAFGILFKNFLEVSDWFGGPQGLSVKSLSVFGWDFNAEVNVAGVQGTFFINYAVGALVLVVVALELARRLDSSWIGLDFDCVRLDEVAASAFGVSIPRWKITAFLLGNFIIGVAGAFYGSMLGFVAPTSFTFADSLILVSIIILGGIGSCWGGLAATVLVVIIPEKLQVIQEYRLLLFSLLVIFLLLLRPSGLLPRPARTLFR